MARGAESGGRGRRSRTDAQVHASLGRDWCAAKGDLSDQRPHAPARMQGRRGAPLLPSRARRQGGLFPLKPTQRLAPSGNQAPSPASHQQHPLPAPPQPSQPLASQSRDPAGDGSQPTEARHRPSISTGSQPQIPGASFPSGCNESQQQLDQHQTQSQGALALVSQPSSNETATLSESIDSLRDTLSGQTDRLNEIHGIVSEMRHLVQRIPNLSAVTNDEEGRYEGDEAEQMISKKRRREGDEEDTAYLGEKNSRKQQRTRGDDAPRQDSMPSKMEALLERLCTCLESEARGHAPANCRSQGDGTCANDWVNETTRGNETKHHAKLNRPSSASLLGALKIVDEGEPSDRAAFQSADGQLWYPVGYIANRVSRAARRDGTRYRWRMTIEEEQGEPVFSCGQLIKDTGEEEHIQRARTPEMAWKRAVKSCTDIDLADSEISDPYGLQSERLKELLHAKEADRARYEKESLCRSGGQLCADSLEDALGSESMLSAVDRARLEASRREHAGTLQRMRDGERQEEHVTSTTPALKLLHKRISVLSEKFEEPPVRGRVVACLPDGLFAILYEDGTSDRGLIHNDMLLTATKSCNIAVLDD